MTMSLAQTDLPVGLRGGADTWDQPQASVVLDDDWFAQPAAGATVVGASLSGAHAILWAVGADGAGAYGIGGTVGANLAGAHAIATAVGADRAGGYAVLTTAGADLGGGAQVLAAVGASWAGASAVLSAAGQSLAGGYGLAGVVGVSLVGGYTLNGSAVESEQPTDRYNATTGGGPQTQIPLSSLRAMHRRHLSARRRAAENERALLGLL